MTVDEVLREFARGCSNAPHDHPWECPDCMEAFARALVRAMPGAALIDEEHSALSGERFLRIKIRDL